MILEKLPVLDTMSGEPVCEKCGKIFSAKKNLYAHLRKLHKVFPQIPKADARIWCAVCGRGFSHKSNLYVHTKKFHAKELKKSDGRHVTGNDEGDKSTEGTLARTNRIGCPGCDKTFTTPSNLNRHLRNSHLEEYDVEITGQVMCFFCKNNIMGGHLFHNHLKDNHGIEVDIEFHLFKTMNDFEVWRKEVEEKTLSLYVKIKGDDNRNPNKVISTYYCNRSGKARVIKSKERNLKKSRPTAKINSSCPSQMVLVKSDDLLKVKYVKTHVGHEADERFLKSKKQSKIALSGRTSQIELLEAIAHVSTEEEMTSLSDCSSLSLVQLDDETMFLEKLDQRLSVQLVTKPASQMGNDEESNHNGNESTNAVDMDLIFSNALTENRSNEMEVSSEISLDQLERCCEIVSPTREVTVVTSSME